MEYPRYRIYDLKLVFNKPFLRLSEENLTKLLNYIKKVFEKDGVIFCEVIKYNNCIVFQMTRFSNNCYDYGAKTVQLLNKLYITNYRIVDTLKII
jgi:hypothetical protein